MHKRIPRFVSDLSTSSCRSSGVSPSAVRANSGPSGAASAALPKMVSLTRENLRRFFAGEPLANAVLE